MNELLLREPGQPARVKVYTDGGCEPNPGPGGWAAIIRFEEHEWVLTGNDPAATNNRMELQAAVAALALLERLQGRCQIELYTDSQYLQQGITGWVDDWVRTGWRTTSGEPVKNQDLWRMLYQLVQAHAVTWHWLKGHADHPFNERADQLATQARRSLHTPAASAPAMASGAAIEHLTPVTVCIKVAGRSGAQAGAWAAVLRMGEHTRDLSGRESGATTNALLIRAATRALEALTRPCRVTIYSDAEYLIKGASQWIGGWQARGWQTKDGKPVANRAEWEALLSVAARHHVTWQIVADDTALPDMERAAQQATAVLESQE